MSELRFKMTLEIISYRISNEKLIELKAKAKATIDEWLRTESYEEIGVIINRIEQTSSNYDKGEETPVEVAYDMIQKQWTDKNHSYM